MSAYGLLWASASGFRLPLPDTGEPLSSFPASAEEGLILLRGYARIPECREKS